MEFCGTVTKWLADAKQVLNAFRHHGVLRFDPKTGSAKFVQCSTPFGIMEFCGELCTSTHFQWMSAQRLSASWSFSVVCRKFARNSESCVHRRSGTWSFAVREASK